MSLDRKRISLSAWLGCVIFWAIGVIANQGFGKIKGQTPGLLVAEVGLLGCWAVGVGMGLIKRSFGTPR